jgi:UDP-N-acetylmuramoyl-L-alanyl-D-glutamate--2,6-diaminopimelate ligase
VDLTELLNTLVPAQVIGEPALEIADLAYDARAVRPGTLFFCVPGATADGHEFADLAVEAGAAALVVERPVSARVPQVVVGDVRAAMALAAVEFFGRPTDELEVAAVTGTNGKTTTTFLLHAVLEAAGRKPGLLGTIESRVGDERRPAIRTTPEAIDLQRTFREMLDAGNRSVALEATSHGSVQKRLLGTRLRCLVFTNLSQDHLDFHGTMEAYYEAKKALFTGELTGSDPVSFTGSDPVKGMPAAAVNTGDPYGRRLADELRPLGGTLVTFGFADDAELKPGELEIDSPLRGRFNVENVLGAVAAGRLLGIDDETIVRGIESLDGVPGRFEVVDEGQPFTVLVDYAHTPEALENVLRAARDLDRGRLICVFGCGGDRDRSKRPVMGRIAGELADLAIVTSDNPRSEDPRAIIDEILAGAEGELEIEPDRRDAIARAVEEAEPGDVVLIAGKGHEQGQQFRDRTVPFDDREVAREALRRLGAAA